MNRRATSLGLLMAAVACGGGGGGGPALGTIQGLVTDTTGAPIDQVDILLRDAGNITTIRGGATNASGVYTFVGVATGSYTIQLTVPPAMQVTGANNLPVTVTTNGTAQADFMMRYLTVSFATHVQGVFNGFCTPCHYAGFGGGPPQGLILTSDSSYAMLVGRAATELGGMPRIKANKPDSSYLVHKIQGTQNSVGGSGVRMPQGAAPLPYQTIQMIRRWVSAGALNN